MIQKISKIVFGLSLFLATGSLFADLQTCYHACGAMADGCNKGCDAIDCTSLSGDEKKGCEAAQQKCKDQCPKVKGGCNKQCRQS